MGRNENTLVHGPLAGALALMTVLALLVAPICAPLCAGKTCASNMRSSRIGQEPCHEMASMGANPADQYLAPSKTCAATDFSAVLVKADRQRANSASALISLSPDAKLESVNPGPGRSGAHRVPLESKSPSPLNTILRI
jgi:hypothetical protein